MRSFDLSIPTRIYFGTNIIKEALKKENELLTGVLLIVTSSKTLEYLGYIDKLKEGIAASKLRKIVEFNQVSANPKLHEIEECIEYARRENVSCVIGFGGGSAMDAAKAVAVGLETKEKLDSFLFDRKLPTSSLPLILIPTTAGTGSELSQGAIITCTKRKKKTAIRGSYVYPRVAIVDPSFTMSVPYKITMETGFDMVAHAVESYVSKAATPFSEMLSEYAIKNAQKALRVLSTNLFDNHAREQISYSSMLMGINLGNVGSVLPHRMQYPIGALTDTSHAAGLISIYLAWIDHGYEFSPQKWNCIGTLISEVDCFNKQDVLNSFRSLFYDLKLHYSLSDLGITQSDINVLVENVEKNIKNDPAYQKDSIIQNIYKSSL